MSVFVAAVELLRIFDINGMCAYVLACCSAIRIFAVRIVVACADTVALLYFICVHVLFCYYYCYSHFGLKRARFVCVSCVSMCLCLMNHSVRASIHIKYINIQIYILFVVTVTHECATLRNVNHLPKSLCVTKWFSMCLNVCI